MTRFLRKRQPMVDPGPRTMDAPSPCTRGAHMDDIQVLTDLNLQFIESFRRGSWELLQPILSPSFSYLDGETGEVWDQERYIEDLRSNPLPTLGIDQVTVHV